jgi:hypothetical protein
MATEEPVFKKTCHVCQRPALTLDDQDRPVCSHHAEAFHASESTYGMVRSEDLDVET